MVEAAFKYELSFEAKYFSYLFTRGTFIPRGLDINESYVKVKGLEC